MKKVTLIFLGILVTASLIWYFKSNFTSPSGLLEKIVTTSNQTGSNTSTAAGVELKTPPAVAISACVDKTAGDVCNFDDNGKNSTGACDAKPGILACAPDESTKNNFVATSTVLSATASSCINNTKNNPQCKDCCDCLGVVDSSARTACRNTCATHDFTVNSNVITVTVPSTLGRSGDYSQALVKTTVNECKIYCENSMNLQCGDYQYCRLACDNKFGVEPGPSGQSTELK